MGAPDLRLEGVHSHGHPVAGGPSYPSLPKTVLVFAPRALPPWKPPHPGQTRTAGHPSLIPSFPSEQPRAQWGQTGTKEGEGEG